MFAGKGPSRRSQRPVVNADWSCTFLLIGIAHLTGGQPVGAVGARASAIGRLGVGLGPAEGQIAVIPHAVAFAADVDDVAVMEDAVDQGGSDRLVAEDFAPLLEALVAGAYRRRVLVAPAHELEEQLGADLGDHHEAREDERAEPSRKVASLLRLLERRDQVGQRDEVDPVECAVDVAIFAGKCSSASDFHTDRFGSSPRVGSAKPHFPSTTSGAVHPHACGECGTVASRR